MKHYLQGLLLLVAMLLAVGLIAVKVNKRLTFAKNGLTQVQEQARSKKVAYKAIEHHLSQSSGYAELINDFLKQWEVFFKKSSEAPKVLNDIVGLSFKNTVAVSEKSAQRSRFGTAEGAQDSIVLSLKVIGKFERIYGWLGEVEEAYPQARITELELGSENKNAALRLKLEIPIVI